MTIVHLNASPFVGGPEHQMLGLANVLRNDCKSVFLSFPEGGKCEALLNAARRHGFGGERLIHNYPRITSAIREIGDRLSELSTDVLCCHGYKPDLLGLIAAKRVGVPVVSISHGWTGATRKVRFNEYLDRLSLNWMDHIVGVSDAQAKKVLATGVNSEKLSVIRNCVDIERFTLPEAADHSPLQDLFDAPKDQIVISIGRLSPEKAFDDFVTAAKLVHRQLPKTGFLIVGDGPLRQQLQKHINALDMRSNVTLAGFREDVQTLLPYADLLAVSSHTEGLPNVALEAFASRVAIVATNVGGLPEIVHSGFNGYLVPPADPRALADRMVQLLTNEQLRLKMGRRGRLLIEQTFTFESQRTAYLKVFRRVQANNSVSSGFIESAATGFESA